jgi:hypothetical protein
MPVALLITQQGRRIGLAAAITNHSDQPHKPAGSVAGDFRMLSLEGFRYGTLRAQGYEVASFAA